jgi:hypothetical protein
MSKVKSIRLFIPTTELSTLEPRVTRTIRFIRTMIENRTTYKGTFMIHMIHKPLVNYRERFYGAKKIFTQQQENSKDFTQDIKLSWEYDSISVHCEIQDEWVSALVSGWFINLQIWISCSSRCLLTVSHTGYVLLATRSSWCSRISPALGYSHIRSHLQIKCSPRRCQCRWYTAHGRTRYEIPSRPFYFLCLTICGR